MSLKTYTAYTMAEALTAVRQDLGPDAVILHTRFYRRGGILGVGRESVVEVTAQSGESSRRQSSRAVVAGSSDGRREAKAAAARQAYGQSGAGRALAVHAVPHLEPHREVLPEERRTRRMAMLLAERHQRQSGQPGERIARDAVTFPVNLTPITAAVDPPNASAGANEAPVARRFILSSPNEPLLGDGAIAAQPAGRRPSENGAAQSTPASVAESSAGQADMKQELAAIRHLVGQVLQRQALPAITPGRDLPAELFDMYLRLIGQDVSQELADQIVRSARRSLSDTEIEDVAAVRAAVLRELAALVPVADEPIAARSPDGRALTIAMVGPTGVGKTTTLAKVAARFKLQQQRRVGLITADTYRIAAVEQLRTYANIIGLPIHVAQTPAEMGQAIHALRDRDVILIDTAGRSQHDRGRLGELRTMLAAAEPHEVHLVLAGTAGQKTLLREAEAFSTVGVHKIVLTKLDEAVSFGVLVEIMGKIGKQLSFLTTGQEVPDHLEPGRGHRLAELVLGEAVRS